MQLVTVRTLKAKSHPQTKALFCFLFVGSRGGNSRIKIMSAILESPRNVNQLSQTVGMDYKAVQHHLQVLEKNNMVTKIGRKYGAVFRLSNFLEINIRTLDEAIDKLELKMNQKKVYL